MKIHKHTPLLLFAGHLRRGTGAVGFPGTLFEFDEAAETTALRDDIAALLSQRYGIAPIVDGDYEQLVTLVRRMRGVVEPTDLCVEIHFNAFTDPSASGVETVIPDLTTPTERAVGEGLNRITAETLAIRNRGIKHSRDTPHRLLAIHTLPCHTVIWEVCFCTSPSDTDAYHSERRKLVERAAEFLSTFLKKGERS